MVYMVMTEYAMTTVLRSDSANIHLCDKSVNVPQPTYHHFQAQINPTHLPLDPRPFQQAASLSLSVLSVLPSKILPYLAQLPQPPPQAPHIPLPGRPQRNIPIKKPHNLVQKQRLRPGQLLRRRDATIRTPAQ